MNFEPDTIGHSPEVHRCPSLSDWRAGTDLPELNPREIRVWLVDLDSGLNPEDAETAEPGLELGVLSDDERARGAALL